MLKVITTLLRGAAAEAEEAVFDANAIRILEQQLRDAAAALELSKRELACAMGYQAGEERAIAGLEARTAELEANARQALAAAREDLAAEAAAVIAANENEKAERQAARDRFDADVRRLRQLSEDGRARLADLKRGLELARAQDGLRRAGANGRRALATGTGALREAEATLVRIRAAQSRDDDVSAALDELERQSTSRDLSERMRDAGFSTTPSVKASDVLARMKDEIARTKGGEQKP
jgi:phage shock protein A